MDTRDLHMRAGPSRVTDYASPYGRLTGLPARLRKWADTLGRDKRYPWLGTGLIADLEAALQILNMTEFAEWLIAKGPPDHARFGDEILSAQAALRVAGYASPNMAANVDGLDDENRANELLAIEYESVRKVLIGCGALAPDDKETSVPDLLRVLLA